MKKTETAAYWRHFLILEPGADEFHENVHFWQHVGTTFGAFELIGFHIAAKAMNRAFRAVAGKGIYSFPYSEATLRELDRDRDSEERAELRRALEYRDLIRSYEGKSAPDTSDSRRESWFVGTPPNPPTIEASKDTHIVLTVELIKEFHIHVLGRLRGTVPPGKPEKDLYSIVTRLIDPEDDRILAYLCDWSLMSPNPQWLDSSREEARPPWRFVRTVDSLREHGLAATVSTYHDFCDHVAGLLHWNSIAKLVNQFERFAAHAEHGSTNTNDAARNRRIYAEIRDRLLSAHWIRIEHPEAFALPHDYEHVLTEILRPLVLKKGGDFVFPDDSTSRWYFHYMHNAVAAIQAFTDSRIGCSYEFFEITDACPSLREAAAGERCLVLPRRDTTPLIECGFLKFINGLKLTVQ